MTNENLLHVVKNNEPDVMWKGKIVKSNQLLPIRVNYLEQMPSEFTILTSSPLNSQQVIKWMKKYNPTI